MTEQKQISLSTYWDVLAAHDWFFEYNESADAHTKGQCYRTMLERYRAQSVAHEQLFDCFYRSAFSGKAFGDPEPIERPARPVNGYPVEELELAKKTEEEISQCLM